MDESATIEGTRHLVAISGPPLEPITLVPKPEGLTLGRHANCDILLPGDAERVSRTHARFGYEDGKGWRLADLGSRWGTFLNGVKLPAEKEFPISDGDLIRITPWTFTISTTPRRRAMHMRDDVGQTMVRTHTVSELDVAKDETLSLILDTAAALHEATDEQDLAQLVMKSACRGTGLTNAAMLRPVDTSGGVEVIASNFGAKIGSDDSGSDSAPMPFSRSLIAAAAASGSVAELSGGATSGNVDIGVSIVQMNISAALCVPLLLGGVPAAFLYLDSRGSVPRPLRRGASDFCVGLGQIASLALANLKRLDVERRQAAMESEMMAAATAQKWVLPPREKRVGPITCLGESRPGRYVGGDFFDVIELGDGVVGIALGDVSGKGMAASVLMTATQGYLHAALREHRDPARAVTAVNQFICPRRPSGKFVTAWVGVFDTNTGVLTYTDAGHSYAVMASPAGEFTTLDAAGGLPIGVDESEVYELATIPLPAGSRVMVVSDGIIEQLGIAESCPGEQKQFGVDGLFRSLAAKRDKGDAITGIFADVFKFAGTTNLSDDATAVLVKW